MKKTMVWVTLVVALLGYSRTADAYIGAGLGVIDEDQFGYGLIFGVGLPAGLSIDAQLVGFADQNTVDQYWIQGNIGAGYDFYSFFESKLAGIELHPYIKGGFTYAALVIDTATIDSEASHGPGFHFGAGLDWKLLPFMTIGIDLTHAVVFLDGVTVAGVPVASDETANVFNVLGTVKFFAY